jgi:hypothetical protein
MAKKIKENEYRILYTNDKRKKEQVSKIIKLSNPITLMASKIQALLEEDPSVLTQFDFNAATLYVYVNDPDKIDAYSFYLKRKHVIGNLCLNVVLVAVSDGKTEIVNAPTYKVKDEEMFRLFKVLFQGTYCEPQYTGCIDQYGTKWNFFQFPACGKRYQADSLENPRGFVAELIVDLIKEVFDVGSYHLS